MSQAIRILGIDPGLRRTGWGLIACEGNRLIYLACGSVETNERLALAERLVTIHDGLARIVDEFRPDEAAVEATLIGDEDPGFAAGSYVIVQKYLHDMPAWNALSTEAQEKVIGRRKLSDIELDDATKPSSAHNALTVLEENGKEIKILRDNMPFGDVARGEFGTYFIGYARSPRPIEQMLENMFVGRPPGNYDRLLDFSRALTGNLFFVPSLDLLDSLL